MKCLVGIIFFLTTSIVHTTHQTAVEIVQRLSLEEKIGQLIMMAVPVNDETPSLQERLAEWHWPTNLNKEYAAELIKTYHIGSVLFIMDGTIADQVNTTNYLNNKNNICSQLPLLFAADYEPGLNFSRIKDAVPFPRAREWGKAGDLQLLYDLGRALGYQAKMMGVQVIFAPVVDVNNNPNNPVINTRSFGDTPEKVIACAEPFMRGIESQGILPVLKHFPGHGDTETDSHIGLPIIKHDRKRLDAIELAPFRELIKRGAHGVMLAHLLVPEFDAEKPSSLSQPTVRVLQNELGFDGLIFSDALNMRALTAYGDSGSVACAAFAAGNHILVGPYDIPVACQALKKAYEAGDISREELDRRVLAVVQFKLQMVQPTQLDPQLVTKEVASPEMFAVLQRLTSISETNYQA